MSKIRDEAYCAWKEEMDGELPEMDNIFEAGWSAALEAVAKQCAKVRGCTVNLAAVFAFLGIGLMLRDPELRWPSEKLI